MAETKPGDWLQSAAKEATQPPPPKAVEPEEPAATPKPVPPLRKPDKAGRVVRAGGYINYLDDGKGWRIEGKEN